MKFLKVLFKAYLVCFFVFGHLGVLGALYIAHEKLGKSPRELVHFGLEAVERVGAALSGGTAIASNINAQEHLKNVNFPSLDAWKGPGASTERKAWRPTYDAKGRPLSEDDLARGAKIHTAATNFPARVVWVDTTKAFLKAVRTAKPGDAITLRPGTYDIKAYSIGAKVSGMPNAPIAVRAEKLGTVTLRMETFEGFHVTAPYWIFENLQIEGTCPDHNRCEHAFHIVGKANSFVLRNNRIYDFNAQLKANGGALVNKNGNPFRFFPNYALIVGNTIADRLVRATGKPVTKLNMNGVSEWIVRGNLIADFEKGDGNKISYAAFMKANGENGVFENNAIICHMRLNGWNGIRLGLSFGGGGTGKKFCRDFTCEAEHTGGIIRNNIILNCPKDVGIYLNRSRNTRIYNNGIYNTTGIDVRFSSSSAYIANNIVEGRIRERDGGASKAENNLILPRGGAANEGLFDDPLNGLFTIKNRIPIVGRGKTLKDMGNDFCGNLRKASKPDLGPIDHGPKSHCAFNDVWAR